MVKGAWGMSNSTGCIVFCFNEWTYKNERCPLVVKIGGYDDSLLPIHFSKLPVAKASEDK